jgi:hypothetical protein
VHTGEDVQATDQDVPPAYATAQAPLLVGRLAQARNTATEALKTDGPSAQLFLVLGQAHPAEDDDDHDDRAEAAYQEGLREFPDGASDCSRRTRSCVCAVTTSTARPGSGGAPAHRAAA